MTSEEFVAKLAILSEKERGHIDAFLDFLTYKDEQERLTTEQPQPVFGDAKKKSDETINPG